VKLRYTPRAANRTRLGLIRYWTGIPRVLGVKTRVRSIINLILQYPHAAPLRSKRGIRCIVVYSYFFYSYFY